MTTQERYWGLDALRGIMMMLGIVLHAATYHLLEAGIGEQDFSLPVLLILGVIHQFRMPLFFVLAGFFTALLVERYQVAGMYQNRIRRILVPFLVGLVTIVPLTNWVFFSIPLSLENGSVTLVTSMSEVDRIRAEADGALPSFFSFMHLWFLYYLMLFYLSVPLLKTCTAWLRDPSRHDRVNRFLANPWNMLAFVAVTMVTLLPFPGAGVAVIDRPFMISPPAVLYYYVFFACGYVFYSFRSILQTFRSHAGLYGVIAFLTFVWFAVTSAMVSAGSDSLAVKFAGSLFASVSTWTFIYYLNGLFLNRFNEDTAWTRFLAQGSYWIYLIHMPLVLLFGVLMMNLPLWPFPAFVLNTVITSAVCIWSYRYVRGSWISLLLNGKRFDAEGRPIQQPTPRPALQEGSAT